MASMRQVVILGCCFAVAVQAAEPGCQSTPLAVAVKKFEAKGVSRIQALLQLGCENQVCFGIEALDQDLLEPSPDFILTDVTVQDAVQKVLSQTSNLRISGGDRIVTIGRVADAHTWLDYVIPEFTAPVASRQALNNLLFMTFSLQIDPSRRGFAGRYPADQGNPIGPFRETRKTVRQLLGKLLTAGGAGVWIAQGITVRDTEIPKNPFWILLDYAIGRDALMSMANTLKTTPQQ